MTGDPFEPRMIRDSSTAFRQTDIHPTRGAQKNIMGRRRPVASAKTTKDAASRFQPHGRQSNTTTRERDTRAAERILKE